MRIGLLTLALTAFACSGYRPAPLSVAITSDPEGANARLVCPNQPWRQGVTPVTFRVPQYAIPCTLSLSKEGFAEQQLELNSDVLRENAIVRSMAAPAPKPLTLEPTATPLSLLGAAIVRWLDNLGSTAMERVATAAVPDAQVHVILDATGQP